MTGRPDAGRKQRRLSRPLTIRTAVVAALIALAAVCTGSSWGARPDVTTSVIVRAGAGQEANAEAAVERLGGHVTRRLAIINGFAATIPASAQRTLARLPGILGVTPNQKLQPLSGSYDPVSDIGSPYNTAQITGGPAFWEAVYTR